MPGDAVNKGKNTMKKQPPIVGWWYDNAVHCPDCWFQAYILDGRGAIAADMDHLRGIYAGDGIDGPIRCKDCGRVIDAR